MNPAGAALALGLLLTPCIAVAQIVVRDPGDSLRGLGIDIRSGDRVTHWRTSAGQWLPLDDALAVWQVEIERAAYGPLPMRIRRGDIDLDVTLPGGRWDWHLDDATTAVIADPASRITAWHTLGAAEGAAREKQWPQAQRACAQALALALDAAASAAVAERCWQMSDAHPDRAVTLQLAQALVEKSRAIPTGLQPARAQLALARSAFLSRDYARAGSAAAQAQRLAGATEPRNTIHAGALHLQGFIAYRQGRYDDALALYRDAERILEPIAAGGAGHASLLGSIAAVHGSRGELDAALREIELAIARMQRVAPAQISLGRMQYNAGVFAFERGRLADAERHLEAALDTFSQAAPAGVEHSMARSQLAQTLERRGESARAEILMRSAVAASAQIDPTAYEALSARLELAIVLIGSKRMNEASVLIGDVLAATAEERSDTLHADALILRADVQLESGQALAALADVDHAIERYRTRNRQLQLARALITRGDALRRLQRFDEAASVLDEALIMRQRQAPQTALEADAHLAIARLHRDRGAASAARAAFSAAIDALEAQHDLLGGNEESRARWAERTAPFYRETLALLLAMDDVDAAWLLLDRYRAREFLASLGQRRRLLMEAMPQALRDEAEAIAADYLRAQKAAQSGSALAADTFDRLMQRCAELERRLTAVEPRLATLSPPRAASTVELAAALPADAALISFAVLPEQTWAFVLRPGDRRPRAIALALDADAVAAHVDALRLLLTAPAAGADSYAALQRRAVDLHARLVAPLDAALGNATRLFVIPDGPLHRLPFAALIEPGSPSRYLAERYAITVLVSASAFLTHGVRIDPIRTHAASDVAILAVPEPGDGSAALPAVRAEAEAIHALFAPRAELSLGPQVSRQRAERALAEADLVHFASHAVIDPGDPLNSFLRLGDGADSRLSAWQVMQAPQARARLVTLSACDSALGLNAGGEGLIGLTRAFQYAGVRSVLATLWRVSDQPTQRLMVAFYRELAAGAPLDIALAQAQRSLLGMRSGWWQRFGLGADFSHPYYWAGFVLTGAPD